MPLVVLVCSHAPRSAGIAQRWLTRIGRSVAVGNISRRVQEDLWLVIMDEVEREGGSVTMVSADPQSPMGYRVNLWPSTGQVVREQDGLVVSVRRPSPRDRYD